MQWFSQLFKFCNNIHHGPPVAWNVSCAVAVLFLYSLDSFIQILPFWSSLWWSISLPCGCARYFCHPLLVFKFSNEKPYGKVTSSNSADPPVMKSFDVAVSARVTVSEVDVPQRGFKHIIEIIILKVCYERAQLRVTANAYESFSGLCMLVKAYSDKRKRQISKCHELSFTPWKSLLAFVGLC